MYKKQKYMPFCARNMAKPAVLFSIIYKPLDSSHLFMPHPPNLWITDTCHIGNLIDYEKKSVGIWWRKIKEVVH